MLLGVLHESYTSCVRKCSTEHCTACCSSSSTLLHRVCLLCLRELHFVCSPCYLECCRNALRSAHELCPRRRSARRCKLRLRVTESSTLSDGYDDRAEMLKTPVAASKSKVRAALCLANVDCLISAADNKDGARMELTLHPRPNHPRLSRSRNG
jgi:hypothetical protein